VNSIQRAQKGVERGCRGKVGLKEIGILIKYKNNNTKYMRII